jgi:hypothetical protein
MAETLRKARNRHSQVMTNGQELPAIPKEHSRWISWNSLNYRVAHPRVKREIAVALIDGPVALDHPDLAHCSGNSCIPLGNTGDGKWPVQFSERRLKSAACIINSGRSGPESAATHLL